MKKRNKIILCICSILVIMASIFSFIPFKSDRYEVSADTIDYTFYSSDYYFVSCRQDVVNDVLNPKWYLSSYNFSIFPISENNSISFKCKFNFLYVNEISVNQVDFSYVNTYNNLYNDNLNTFIDNNTIDITYGDRSQVYFFKNIGNNNGFPMGVYQNITNIFFDTLDVKFVSIEKAFTAVADDFYDEVKVLQYKFTNSNSTDVFVLEFLTPLNYIHSSNTYSLIDSASSNYKSGYDNGYNIGYIDGSKNGSSLGYDNGYNVGYNNGYNVGLNDSNQYTFLNLISATIDAPITYFQSLFNFELLGVNLQGFLTGLFTLCVIVTIIKLCLGR